MNATKSGAFKLERLHGSFCVLIKCIALSVVLVEARDTAAKGAE